MLDVYELMNLEDELKQELEDNLGHILSRLNREDKIEELLDLLGLSNLLHVDSGYKVQTNGKIIIIGKSEIAANIILAIAERFGINKRRLELHLEYEDAVKFDFRKTQYDPTYSLIMVGPMPHSAKSKEEYGSAISAIENKDGYPPVVRLGSNGLKITKSDLKSKFAECISSGLIQAA